MLFEAVLLVFIYFLVFFIVGTIIKNNSIVDMGWGIGFVLVAWFSLIREGSYSVVSSLVTILISLWGLRLFYHIFKRNVGKPEDFRYANWRKEWGKWVVPRSFFQVYMLQGLFMLVIVFPVVLAIEASATQINALTVFGTLVWVVGYYFEVVGDAQLRRFKAKPESKGQLMTEGLWRFTRHPNYFGEAVMWWGIAFISISTGSSELVLMSPVVITFLLRFVSGVPMLEASMKNRPGYEAYARQTNVFIPMRPKGR